MLLLPLLLLLLLLLSSRQSRSFLSGNHPKCNSAVCSNQAVTSGPLAPLRTNVTNVPVDVMLCSERHGFRPAQLRRKTPGDDTERPRGGGGVANAGMDAGAYSAGPAGDESSDSRLTRFFIIVKASALMSLHRAYAG